MLPVIFAAWGTTRTLTPRPSDWPSGTTSTACLASAMTTMTTAKSMGCWRGTWKPTWKPWHAIPNESPRETMTASCASSSTRKRLVSLARCVLCSCFKFSWNSGVKIVGTDRTYLNTFSVGCILQVHVNLMVFEARLQAELLYALRAVMRYMTWWRQPRSELWFVNWILVL